MSNVQFTDQEIVEKLFPIYFYRKNLDLAAKDLLGLNLSPHHRLVLRDWGRGKTINVFFASRGKGKSVCMAIFFVLMCLLYPNLKVVAVGGQGFRGSKMILVECERIIRGNLMGQEQVGFALHSVRNKLKVIFKDNSYWAIEFENGSEIRGVPLGLSSGGSGIRGTRAHILGEDEAYLIPHKLYQEVLEPMQNVLYEPHKDADDQILKNMLISVSTCDFDFRDFFRQYEYYLAVLKDEMPEKEKSEFEMKKEDISLFNFDLDDSYYVHDGKRKTMWGIDYTRIMKKKSLPTTDQGIWMSENKNIPQNIQGGYFSFADVDAGMNLRIVNNPETFPEVLSKCSGQCVLGVDCAPSGDNTAFVVIKIGTYNCTDFDAELCQSAALGVSCPMLSSKNKCMVGKRSMVVHAYEENKMSQLDRVKKIYEIMDRFNIVAVGMDARGGGYELESLLNDKDYVQKFVSPISLPLFDPKRIKISGLSILTMYSTTQDMNTEFNAYMRGLISSSYLLFPKPLHSRPGDPFILKSAGHIETLVNQIARIKAIPAGMGVKFIIETIDSNTGRVISARKDLYSALMYGVACLKNLSDEAIKESVIDELPRAMPVKFNVPGF